MINNRISLAGAGLVLLGAAIACSSRLEAAEGTLTNGQPVVVPLTAEAGNGPPMGTVGVAEASSSPFVSEAAAPTPAAPSAAALTPVATAAKCLSGSGVCVGESNCCCGTACGDPADFWFRGEFLNWWTKGARIPALVGTGPAANPFVETAVLFGDSTVNGGDHEGFRATMGMWLDCCHCWALEGDYFDLGGRPDNYDSGFSNGFPVLVRPFVLPGGGLAYESVAFPTGPNALAGRVTVDTGDYFQSAGVWLRCNLYCCECGCGVDKCDLESYWAAGGANTTRVDAIAGYRFYRLMDHVAVHEQLVDISGGPSNGNQFDVRDSFRAQNDFNGVDLGIDTNITRGRWSFGLLTKAAFGLSHQAVDIFGQTISTDNTGVVTTMPGGLLALGTNMGDHSRDRFCVVPQLSTEVGYQLNPHTKLTLGYDILYWDKVLRAGEQINPIVDPLNIPPPLPGGGPHPEFTYREASFWAQGFHVGAELRF